jgi:hypothetical protein
MEQIKLRSRNWSDLVLDVYSLVSDASVQANAEFLFAIDGCFEICTGFRINYSNFALTTLSFTNINPQSTYLLSHHLIHAFKFLAQ